MKWSQVPDNGTQWIGLSIPVAGQAEQYQFEWLQVDGGTIELPNRRNWTDYTLANGHIYVCVVLTGPQSSPEPRVLDWIRLGDNLPPHVGVSTNHEKRLTAPALITLSTAGCSDPDGYVANIEINSDDCNCHLLGTPESLNGMSISLPEPGTYTFQYSGYDDEHGYDPPWPGKREFVVFVRPSDS